MVIQIFRELHNAGHTILMVTHDPDIARQADRRIELAHGHLHFDTAQHGPGHPLACPLADTADGCTPTPSDDEISFDHLLKIGVEQSAVSARGQASGWPGPCCAVSKCRWPWASS